VRIDIVERAAVRVACRRHTGDEASRARFWRGTMTPWLADHGLLDCPRYGVTLDDPRRTAPQECRYDACVALPIGLGIPEAVEMTIPGGSYAITRFKGRAEELGAAWEEFMAELSRHEGIHVDAARHAYEHHPRGSFHDPRSGMFCCELCLPVTRA
jgi:AraC family transcriptional regulator